MIYLRQGHPAIVAESFRDHAPDAVFTGQDSDTDWLQWIIIQAGPKLGQAAKLPIKIAEIISYLPKQQPLRH